MITVAQAQHLVAKNLHALNPVKLNLADASGHVLAENVLAVRDIPSFCQSSMDGYAFKLDKNRHEFNVIAEIAAGAHQRTRINNGEACRIFTGAPLPFGADTVVMQEKTQIISDRVSVLDPELYPGANVRQKGAEIKAGALAAEKGMVMNAARTGFIASLGIAELSVYPKPMVTILITGDELQQPGKPLGFGQVYESNSFTLLTAMKSEGIEKIEIHRVKDDLKSISETLAMAIDGSDVILLTGGVSVGDYDFIIQAAARCGIEKIFHKVRQKPGKPLFFGTAGDRLIFGLPGNPSSVLTCYHLYVLPALKALSGKSFPDNQFFQASLATDYKKSAEDATFLKGFYGNGVARPLQEQKSYQMRPFAQANCLIHLKEDQQYFFAGSSVTIIPINY